MAIEFSTEEFQRAYAEIVRTMEQGLPLSREQLELLKKHNELNAKINASLGRASKAAQDFAKATYDGTLGMGQLSSGIDAVTSTISAVSSIIMPASKLLRVALGGLTIAAELLGKYFKASGNQADALFKSYQELGKTGQNAAGGIGDVARQLVELGYGIKEIDNMTALLKENSETLAVFGSTAGRGTKAFAEASQQIRESNIGDTLLKMGKTPDDINRGIVYFIKNQQALGISSAKTQQDLSTQAGKYIMQLDLLARLTGQSVDKAQEQQEMAMAEEAYAQKRYELLKKGDQASLDQVAEMDKMVQYLAKSPAYLKEYLQGVGGDISAMGKSMMVSPEYVAQIQSGTFKAATAMQAFGKDAELARDRFGGVIKLNASLDFLGPLSQLGKVASTATEGFEKREKAAEDDQKTIKNNLEANTKDMVDAQKKQRDARDGIQDFVRLGIGPATTALNALAGAASSATKVLPGGGGGGGGAAPSGGIAPKSQTFGTAGPGAGPISQGDLAKMGLRIKNGDVQAEGATLSPALIQLAQQIQSTVPGFAHFTGFNDRFHNEKAPGSSHTRGLAMDFVLDHQPTREEGQKLTAMLKSMGASYVQDEYNNPSAGATAGHIHAQVSGLNGFNGMLTGPAGGYRPNIEMHGREQLTITPTDPGKRSAFGDPDATSLMSKQLDKMDEMVRGFNDRSQQEMMSMQLSKLDQLVRVMQDQVNVSTKILQASR